MDKISRPNIIGPADLWENRADQWRVPFRKGSAAETLVLPEPLAWENEVVALHHAAAGQPIRSCRILVVYGVEDIAECREFLRDLAQQQDIATVELLLCAPNARDVVVEALRQSGLDGQVLPSSLLSTDAREQIQLSLERCDFVAIMHGAIRLDPGFWCRAVPVAQLCPGLLQVLEQTPDYGPCMTPFAVKTALQMVWTSYNHLTVSSLNMFMSVDLWRQMDGLPLELRHPNSIARAMACRAVRQGAYVSPLLVPFCRHRQDVLDVDDWARLLDLCPEIREGGGVSSVPRLSVLITTEDAPCDTVRQTIESVLSQGWSDIEICVSSGPGALEGTYKNHAQVNWFESDFHLDLCSMIDRAKGQYILGIRSGDVLLPGALQRMWRSLAGDPRAVICAGGVEFLEGEAHNVLESLPAQSSCPLALLQGKETLPVFMFRRSYWARTRPLANYNISVPSQLYDLSLRLAETGTLMGVREVLVQRSSPDPELPISDLVVTRRAAIRRMGLARDWEVDDCGHIVRRTGRPMVVFWPDFSRANPYQNLLYAKTQASHEFLTAPIDVAIAMLEQLCQDRNPPKMTFHLHWTSFLFQDIKTRGQARLKIRAFIKSLARFKALGGRVIWTVHNTISHDSPFVDLERGLSERLVALADIVHLHSAASLPEVRAEFDVPLHKVRIAHHGHYVSVYADVVSRETARALLGIEAEERVILFLGQVRPYKGVGQLVQSFRQILKDTPHARLLIGGAIHDAFWDTVEPALNAQERARILASERFLDETELQLFLRAADLAVFPYRNILTSGSLLLALSFDLPVVIPEVGMTREVLKKPSWGVLYDGNDPSALGETMRSALEGMVSVRGHKSIEELTWFYLKDGLLQFS